jgi:hypothetical protein
LHTGLWSEAGAACRKQRKRENQAATARTPGFLGIWFQDNARYNEGSIMAEDKLFKAEYLGSGTFVISKPKRKKAKMRQSQLKNPQRGSRK